MEFALRRKDYRREYYEAPFTWKGVPLKAQVRMQYHTFLKYWDVCYDIKYAGNYSTPCIKSENNVVGKTARKTVRRFAEQYMEQAKPSDVEKLDAFYQQKILESKGR
jgi:hypothetical protein